MGEMNRWYNRINPMTSSAGSRTSARHTFTTGPPPSAGHVRGLHTTPGRAAPAPRRNPAAAGPRARRARGGPGVGGDAARRPRPDPSRRPPRPAVRADPAQSAPRSSPTALGGRAGWSRAPATAGAAGVRVAARQTDRRARPLLRRDDRMDRPARVRMRSRKPCFLCRRRLFGWYVRFIWVFLPKPSTPGERGIGPHRQPPSTTPVHDKGQPPQHTSHGRIRGTRMPLTPRHVGSVRRHADTLQIERLTCAQSVVRGRRSDYRRRSGPNNDSPRW